MKFEEFTEEKMKNIERSFLIKTKEFLKQQVEKQNNIDSRHIDAFTFNKILNLIDRVFNNEVEFLHDEPDEYFELYLKDHLKN